MLRYSFTLFQRPKDHLILTMNLDCSEDQVIDNISGNYEVSWKSWISAIKCVSVYTYTNSLLVNYF